MAGWGSVSNFEEPPPGLMEAEVRVLGLDVCNSSWKGQLSPAMVCTHSGDRRRRGFCSVRCSLSIPPTCHMGKPRPTEKGRAGQSLGNQVQLTLDQTMYGCAVHKELQICVFINSIQNRQ